MRTRTTAAAAAVLALALTACGSSGTPELSDSTSSAAASPSVDVESARQDCIEAWLKQLEADTASAESEPAVCEDVPGRRAAMYAEALRQHNAANRERMDDCLEDPSCTEFPVP